MCLYASFKPRKNYLRGKLKKSEFSKPPRSHLAAKARIFRGCAAFLRSSICYCSSSRSIFSSSPLPQTLIAFISFLTLLPTLPSGLHYSRTLGGLNQSQVHFSNTCAYTCDIFASLNKIIKELHKYCHVGLGMWLSGKAFALHV